MSRFSIKSILLGLGMGIVLMSIVSLIYMAGYDPAKDLSKEQVIKLAETYGMVKGPEILNKTGASRETGGTERPASETAGSANDTAPSENKTAGPVKATGKQPAETGESQAQKEVQTVTVTIGEGATSERIAARLHAAGLITDEEAFVKLLGELGLEDKIQVGTFKIVKGSSMKEIAGAITK